MGRRKRKQGGKRHRQILIRELREEENDGRDMRQGGQTSERGKEKR